MNITVIEVPNPQIKHFSLGQHSSNAFQIIQELKSLEGVVSICVQNEKIRIEKSPCIPWINLEKRICKTISRNSAYTIFRSQESEEEIQREAESYYLKISTELDELKILVKE